MKVYYVASQNILSFEGKKRNIKEAISLVCAFFLFMKKTSLSTLFIHSKINSSANSSCMLTNLL